MRRLEGKVAIITGAASGIGLSTAQLFASEGARLVMADIDRDGIGSAVEGIRSAGGTAEAIAVDVGEPDDVERMVSLAVETFGRLDILHNNAGGSTPRDGSATEVDLGEFWRAIRVDLFGSFLGCRFAIPRMIESGGGSVINMVSNVALIGVPGMDCYTAAKGGVAALTRSLAATYAKDGVRVNAIAPSVTLSPRVRQRLEGKSASVQALAQRNLLGFAEPQDIARAALFLASDDSRMSTGAILLAESGSTIA